MRVCVCVCACAAVFVGMRVYVTTSQPDIQPAS